MYLRDPLHCACGHTPLVRCRENFKIPALSDRCWPRLYEKRKMGRRVACIAHELSGLIATESDLTVTSGFNVSSSPKGQRYLVESSLTTLNCFDSQQQPPSSGPFGWSSRASMRPDLSDDGLATASHHLPCNVPLCRADRLTAMSAT
jgi:hypothetical protein